MGENKNNNEVTYVDKDGKSFKGVVTQFLIDKIEMKCENEKMVVNSDKVFVSQ